jgi:hypothetical protein
MNVQFAEALAWSERHYPAIVELVDRLYAEPTWRHATAHQDLHRCCDLVVGGKPEVPLAVRVRDARKMQREANDICIRWPHEWQKIVAGTVDAEMLVYAFSHGPPRGIVGLTLLDMQRLGVALDELVEEGWGADYHSFVNYEVNRRTGRYVVDENGERVRDGTEGRAYHLDRLRTVAGVVLYHNHALDQLSLF